MPINYPFPVTHINLTGNLFFFVFTLDLFLEIGSLNYVGRGTWIRERLELYVFGVVFKFEVLTSQLWGQKVFRAFFSSGICIQVLAVLFGFVCLVFFFFSAGSLLLL